MKAIFARLDPVSRLTLWRMTVLIGVMVAICLQAPDWDETFAALALMATFVALFLALCNRERFGAHELNRWDEGAAYLGLYSIAAF